MHQISTLENHEFDAIIIGGGIGGLLTGADLSKRGSRVCIIERLKFMGGRFTDFNKRGYHISSGAIHLLPHGKNGTMGSYVNSLIDQPISNLKASYFSRKVNSTTIIETGKKSYARSVIHDKLHILSAIGKYVADGRPHDVTAHDYLAAANVAEELTAHLEKFCQFTLSLSLQEMPAYQLAQVSRKFVTNYKPGIIHGGCGSTIGKLTDSIESYGGTILNNSTVESMWSHDSRSKRVRLTGTRNEDLETEVTAPVIISDTGPKHTMALLSKELTGQIDTKLTDQVQDMTEASGFKFHVKVNKPPFKEAGVVFPLDTSRIGGWITVSQADSTLAPPDSHMLIAHATMKSPNMKREIDVGIEELEDIIGPDFEYEDILSIGTFKDAWPVNRAKQGEDITMQNPLPGFYMVGDGCKPEGYPMVEGVARSVQKVINSLKVAQH